MTLAQRTVLAAGLAAALTAVAHAEDDWGALAFSPSTEVMGYSQGQANAADARDAALGQCERDSDAKDCAAVTFRNACGAVAIGKHGWGAGTGADEDKASNAAQRRCAKRTKDCDVESVHCSP